MRKIVQITKATKGWFVQFECNDKTLVESPVAAWALCQTDNIGKETHVNPLIIDGDGRRMVDVDDQEIGPSGIGKYLGIVRR